MPRLRLDTLLVERGLVPSREKAQRLILAGQVRVQGHPNPKPGQQVPTDTVVELIAQPRFVSRGGDKLQAALDHFQIALQGKLCMDVGASTGGFTDCMLQAGASRVIAVDVGKGQLDERLRQDSRVVQMMETNARALEAGRFEARPMFAAVDVAFISLTKVLPSVTGVMADSAELVTLIKPQFEAGRGQVGKGGVVRDAAVRDQVVELIRQCGIGLGLDMVGVIESPLKGPAGNIEYLMYWRKGEKVTQS